MSQYPSASWLIQPSAIDWNEFDTDAELAREAVRELDVEAHEVSGLVEEGERQRVGQVPDAQHLAGLDGLERRQARRGRRRRRAGHRGLDLFMEQVHGRQHAVLRVLLRRGIGKQHARATDDQDNQTGGHARV